METADMVRLVNTIASLFTCVGVVILLAEAGRARTERQGYVNQIVELQNRLLRQSKWLACMMRATMESSGIVYEDFEIEADKIDRMHSTLEEPPEEDK